MLSPRILTRLSLAVALIPLAACPWLRAQASGDEEVSLVPGGIQGEVRLVLPAAAAGEQASLDPDEGILAGTVRAVGAAEGLRSLLSSTDRDLEGAQTVPGGPPSETSALFTLGVLTYGGPYVLEAELVLGPEGEDRYLIPAGPETDCFTRCVLERNSAVDMGCLPSCSVCLDGCDPPPELGSLLLEEEAAVLEVRWAHACEGLEIAPTRAEVRVLEDVDGDGAPGPGDRLRASTAFTNPDVLTPEAAPAGERRLGVRLPVPSGVPLLVEGEATFGGRRRALRLREDPRTPGGPLVLVPGERFLWLDPVPLSGADLPPGFNAPPGRKECQPPDTGRITGSFDLRDPVTDTIVDLIAFEASASGGPSDGALDLVDPPGLDPKGVPRGPGPFIPEWRLTGLVPNTGVDRDIPDAEGDLYASADPVAVFNKIGKGPARKGGRNRVAVSGLSSPHQLLAADPGLDLAGDCGIDPSGDPDAAVIAAQQPLVVAYNDPPLEGLESLNGAAASPCPLEGAPFADPARPAVFADGLRLVYDRRGSQLFLPAHSYEMRAGLVKGVLRILDGVVDDRGDVFQLGVEDALRLAGLDLERGETFVRAVGVHARGFEASRGVTADALPVAFNPAGLGGPKDTLRLPAGTPASLGGLQAFYGMPRLLDLASLEQADLADFGYETEPDLSYDTNRRAFDRSESLYHTDLLVGQAHNVPGVVAARTLHLRFQHDAIDGGHPVDGRLRVVDVTKPVHGAGRVDGARLAGGLPSSFPGPDFPAIAFPIILSEDVEDTLWDGSTLVIPAGTELLTAREGSSLFLDPALSDGSHRFGTAWANDGPDSTVDTEPFPDPNPDDNDSILDRITTRDPRLVKPDDDLSTRSTLMDRLVLEPEELSVENQALCFGQVLVVMRTARRSSLVEPVVTGRGFLNALLDADADGDTFPDPLSSVRPDLGRDLNEDGVEDQYLVLYGEEGEGFHGRPTRLEGFRRVGEVLLLLPAGDHLLEPRAVVRRESDGDLESVVSFGPVEVSVSCGGKQMVSVGPAACPLTQGFWKRVCKGPHPSGEFDNLPDYVSYVASFATFADVGRVEDLCDRLHPDPRNEKCEQAEGQFMAMLLNLASGRVPEDAAVSDPDASADEAAALAEEVDAILSGAPGFQECVLAQSIADDFNNGISLPSSDACGEETAPPPVGNSLRVGKTAGGPAWLRFSWKNLPPGQARKHALVQLVPMQGLPPDRTGMDDLSDWLVVTAEGPDGIVLQVGREPLIFFKVLGLSPSWEIPGSTRVGR